MDRSVILIFLLSLFQLTNCQDMNKDKNSPSYNIQLSHTDNKFSVRPVKDSIITLERTVAHLPYGGSSGTWGNSGKGFTEQTGTPLGADIIYYSRSENAFYHLKASFQKEKIIDLAQRAYAMDESFSTNEPLEEYININKQSGFHKKYNQNNIAYKSFSDLIFGFAPKGTVIIWIGYGPNQTELGEYQADLVKNKDEIEKYEKLYQKTYRVSPELFEEMAREYYISDSSPEQWKLYRTRYNWKPQIKSENKGLKLFSLYSEYYNGEKETMLRPWINNPSEKERAVPREITFFWETSKGEAFEGRAFFNWKKTDEAFKKAGTRIILEFRIEQNNNNFEVLLNGQQLGIDSTRVFKSEREFKESYK